jgi:hypothetical protein
VGSTWILASWLAVPVCDFIGSYDVPGHAFVIGSASHGWYAWLPFTIAFMLIGLTAQIWIRPTGRLLLWIPALLILIAVVAAINMMFIGAVC